MPRNEAAWLALEPAYLPWELARRPQWMCWRPERTESGAWSKAPRDPRTGRHAAKTDPGHWGTIYEAIDGMRRHHLAGVGYCVTAEDPFVFADLDHCRHPESGEIDAHAAGIIDALASWTELSPSGTGIRIIVRGSLPPSGRHNQAIELYDAGAFLTLTGQHVAGTPWLIHDRTAALAALHARTFPPAPAPIRAPIPAGRIPSESAVLDKARRAKNGATFEALYSGRWQSLGRYPSQSEADLALARSLAHWTNGDPVMIDTLFRSSGLMRDKWDVKHHANGLTYGEATIVRALGSR